MVIEKGVPIPQKNGPRSAVGRTVEQMEVNDSVLVDTVGKAQNLLKAGKVRGRKMTFRKVDGGWRIWRIS